MIAAATLRPWPAPQRSHGARRRRRADDRRGRRALPRARRLRAPRPPATGSRPCALAAERRPDLVVLDLMLPELDGLEVLRRLARGRRPAHAGDPADREGRAGRQARRPAQRRRRLRRQAVLAERAGRARGRGAPTRPPPDERDAEPLRFDGLEIDVRARRVTAGGEEVQLSQREFDLLQLPRLPPRPGVLARPADGPGLGVGTATPTPAPSPSTSAGCGRRSSPTPSGRASSRRCGASATASSHEPLAARARRCRRIAAADRGPAHGVGPALVTAALVAGLGAPALVSRARARRRAGAARRCAASSPSPPRWRWA